MVAAFVHAWPLPFVEIGRRASQGHLLLEVANFVKLLVLGSLLGSLWWRIAAHGQRTCISVLFVLSLLAVLGWMNQLAFWIGWWTCLLPVLVAAWQQRAWIGEQWRVFWGTARGWNGYFFFLWIIIWLTCDLLMLREAPPGAIQVADAALARLLTHIVIASGVWAIVLCHDHVAPRFARIAMWALIMSVPLIVIVNSWLRVWWGKGIMEMIGELEIGGKIEFTHVWAAGGLEITPAVVIQVLLVLAVTVAVFAVCRSLSVKAGFQVTVRRLCTVAALAWMVLQVEQAIAMQLKERGWSWWERKTFRRRMTWLEPEPGLASYEVKFKNPQLQLANATLKHKPDVFLFLVESLRGDVITPQTAPFLTRYLNEECQPIQTARAASNVTHQSWFSVLSGRLPVFMLEGQQKKALAPLPALLKAAGYRVEARMVNDFDYMEMVATNFGKPLQADVVEQVSPGSAENLFKVPQREVRMIERLKKSVISRSAGGFFALTGMDSTHYNYKWGINFSVPYADYEPNPLFPVRPTETEIDRIKKRYWNSVAWVDAQIGGFIQWLKDQGRHDDALIIIAGDHGEEFREFGSWFHGTMLNEPQTNVGLLIKWPRSLGFGRGPDVAVASHLDIVPSIADALGCEPRVYRDLPGISLLRPSSGNRPTIMSTHFCGRNGEALLIRQNDTEVAFGWNNFWTPHVPSILWVERVHGVSVGSWQSDLADVAEQVFEQVVTR